MPAPIPEAGENERNIAMRKSTYPWRHSGAIPLKVSGKQLAQMRLTKLERARIAGAVMDGEIKFVGFSQRQVADICQVSLAYARRMRRPQNVVRLEAAE
jgi:hypothetical protein